MCTRPREAFAVVDEDGKEHLLWKEPIGADPESYELRNMDCGRCPSCLEKRARNLAIRCMHEAQMHKASAFLTITYDDEHLPPHGSVCKSDVQAFLKRLRRVLEPVKLRFLVVAEYGTHTYRAHYHMLCFGTEFRLDRRSVGKSQSGFPQWESDTLTQAWGKGRCTVGELTKETCFYVCRYALKSASPPDRKRGRSGWWQHPQTLQWLWREREFQLMSLKPGLGRTWLERFHRDVYSFDQVVTRDGAKFRPPRYYDTVLREWSEEDWQRIKAKRIAEAMAGPRLAEGAPHRLQAIEVVQQAKHNLSKRGL